LNAIPDDETLQPQPEVIIHIFPEARQPQSEDHISTTSTTHMGPPSDKSSIEKFSDLKVFECFAMAHSFSVKIQICD
jgi:hypothetical protein